MSGNLTVKAFDLDLTRPEDARKFFREYRGFDGKPVIEINVEGRGFVNPLLADDREVCEYAIAMNTAYLSRGIGFLQPEVVH